MIRKYATLETLSSSFATKSLRRSAHKADFSKIAVRPGYLYVRSRAISSRTNDNYDTFPAEEIKKGYLSFIGKPVFVNHENENHRRARGVILDAQLHEDRNIDNSPDTWVEVLMEVDAIRFPKLAEAIVKGHIERTSMGVDVEMSECGVCHNEARTPMEYCAHIPRMKGSKIRQVTASGTQQDVLVHEVCYGLAFFENSLLVEEPADPTAYFLGVDTSGLEMQATKRAIATRKRAVKTEKTAKMFTSQVPEMTPGICYIVNTGSFEEVKLMFGVLFDTENEADRFADYFPKYLGWHSDWNEPTALSAHIDVIYYGPAGNMPNSNGVKYYNRMMQAIDESGVRVEWICNKRSIEDIIEETLDRCSPDYRAQFPDLYYSYATKRTATHKTGYTKNAYDLHHYIGTGKGYKFVATDGSGRSLLDIVDVDEVLSVVDEMGGVSEKGWEVYIRDTDEFIGYIEDEGHGRLSPNEVSMLMAASRKPKAFGGRKVSTLSKTARRKVAEGKTTNLPCGCSIIPAFTQGVRSGDLVADGWHLIDNQGHWAQTYWTKAEAKESHASYPPCQMTIATKRKVGYGEIVAPPAVDTLRQENCPICGADEYGGDQCLVCGFTKPPEMYMDPDLGAAGLNDLREEQGLAGAAMDNPNGMSGDMTPGLDTNNPVVENVLAGDVQPLECDSCGSAFDYSPEMAQQPAGQVVEVPATSADNEQPAENPANSGPIAPGSADGDVPPTPNAQTDDEPGTQEAEPEPPAGESLPKSETDSNDETHDDPSAQDDAEADVPQDPSNNDDEESSDEDPSTNGDDINSKSDSDAAISDTTDVFDDLQPGDPCPDCNGGTLGHPTEDNPLNATDENPDPDGDGDDDRLGSENDPNHAEEEQEIYDEEEDEDEKSKSGPSDKSKKSNKEVRSRRTTVRRRSQKEDSMARPLVQAVAEQQKIIKRQASEIASLKKAVGRIERLAGIRSTADAANPAQPIPQPGGGAAYPGSSLEEARTPGARGNVSDIGGVAETTNVGAYTTDSVDNIGMSSPSGYDITQDVTTPVAGTETMRPIDEVRTRPVIEFGNPLKPDFAFPLEGDFAQRATVDSSARIYASLRLARLRIEAGTNESSDDEIAEGEAIANDETKSNDDIKNEIETLSKVMRSAARKAPKTASRNLVPQARGGRKVPSVAKAGGISTVASASAGSSDDPFLFI